MGPDARDVRRSGACFGVVLSPEHVDVPGSVWDEIVGDARSQHLKI
jgi:hypothetical protein